MAADPSQSVHERLLPHIHLISSFRYPTITRLDFNEVAKWLLAAPKIARDTAPFYWTYLDTPSDGQVFLTWQPLQRLGTEFATDGYVWSAGEQYFQHDVGNGVILEVFWQRAGYRPGEQFATHSRRRFRLTPPKVPTATSPQVDPSLWIVHYGPTETNERIPINMMPIDPRTNPLMQARMQLQRGGQIARKDFMLADRGNWPQIPLPREGRGQAMYATQANARGVPQQMAYPPHAGVPPAHPSKRARTGGPQPPQQHVMGGAAPAVPVPFEDDEETSGGDALDHVIPREVFLARYQQNHEWMEELMNSPWRISQIQYADLGLGLQGELAPLTEGIFEARGATVESDEPKKPYVGRLDPGLADEFRKRVADNIASTNAEIEQMKAQHDKTLAKFKANSLIKHAEQDLRAAVKDTGPEYWRLEGRVDDSEDGAGHWNRKHHKNVEDVVASVESALGRHARVVHDVLRVQDGGYQEPAPEEPLPPPQVTAPPSEAPNAGPGESMSRQQSQSGLSQTGFSQNSGVMVGDSDIDMGGTAAGLLDQFHGGGGGSATSTPNNFPTPQVPTPQPPSAEATPAAPEPEVPKDNAVAAPDGDWVVVPKGGVSPVPPDAASTEAEASAAVTAPADTQPANETKATSTSSKPASAAQTPAVADNESMALDGDNFSSLGDLDTAGEALAGYEPPLMDGNSGDMGDGLDLNMEMENWD